MKKGWFCTGVLLLAIFLIFTGCPMDDDADPVEVVVPSAAYGDGTFDGNVVGSEWGYGSKKITLTLSIEKGIIKNIVADHNETADIGGAFITKIIPMVIAANSFDIDAISTATCTYTRDGFKTAGKAAIKQIPGEE